MAWLLNFCRRYLSKWVFIFLIPIGLAVLINHYGVAISVVNGTSMQPTLQHGDRLLINKLSFLVARPDRGDVVTFRDPHVATRYLVKRVIGLPGDVIAIRRGVLYCNGTTVPEKYIDTPIEDGNFGPIVVKQGTLFVMGDNRHRFASRDSRYQSVGLVPIELVNGKVEFILWRPSLMAHL
ncbi:signal peptidase I [Seinonella peptonophila]|uniref:Signal peptidase I n=1 Tax=Seinonella peptonophila TaxID=112248 RepID=A0A1M4ZI82_9BACL|nr:signal peptidase I [Seinonella peptonophila]SHF17744.1 signal peptidase I [Seinonella peptonophila]